MKKTLLSSAIAAVLFAACLAWACFTSSQASAQAPMAPAVAGPGGIALVDVNYIFKKHVRLKAQLSDLQAEADESPEGLRAAASGPASSRRKQLNAIEARHARYQRLEEKLVSQKADHPGTDRPEAQGIRAEGSPPLLTTPIARSATR